MDTISRFFKRHLIPMTPANEGNGGGGTGDGAGAGDGGAGGGQGSWIDTLPAESQTMIAEEDRKDPAVTKYKTIPDLVKGYRSAQELLGRKGIIVPTEKSTPEEVNAFQMALGRPEKPEGYKLTQVKDLHASVQVTPESAKPFLDFAHKVGMPQGMADQLNGWYLQRVSAQMADREKAVGEANKSAEAGLRHEWGADYDKNIGYAKRFVEKHGGKDAIDAFGDLGSNIAVLRVLGAAGKMIAEDDMSGDRGGRGSSGATQVEQQIAGILGDQKHPYWDDNHADHRKWTGQNGLMADLYKKAQAEKDAGQ
jgi:hypothetical protein